MTAVPACVLSLRVFSRHNNLPVESMHVATASRLLILWQRMTIFGCTIGKGSLFGSDQSAIVIFSSVSRSYIVMDRC